MGPHRTDRHLQLGRLMTPNTALLLSMIDETVPDHASLVETARQRCLEYIAVPHHSRSRTKIRSAQSFIATMEEGHDELVEGLWEDIQRTGEGSFREVVTAMMSRGKK